MRVVSLILILLMVASCTGRRQQRFFNIAEEKIQVASYFEATDALRRGISLNPESAMSVKALYRLAFVQEVYLHDYESALQSYQEYFRLGEDVVGLYEVQKRIANIYFESLQDPGKAIAAYQKLLELQPSSLESDYFVYRIGRASFMLNDFEKARSDYQKFTDLFPKSALLPKARFEIGNTYFVEGKFALAIEAFKQVIRYHPQHPRAVEAQFWMAQAFEQLGDFKEARSNYEQLRLKYPTPQVVEKRLKDLEKRKHDDRS